MVQVRIADNGSWKNSRQNLKNYSPMHPKNLADMHQIQKISRHPKNMKSKAEISQEMLGVDKQTGDEGFLWKS